MKHAFLDHHAGGHSAVHRLHPGTKAGIALGLMSLAVGIPFPDFRAFLPGAVLLGAGALVCRVPLFHLLGKMKVPLGVTVASIILLPVFRVSPGRLTLPLGPVEIPVYIESARLAAHILCRAAVALLAMVLLTATTPFQDLLHVLERVRCPGIFLRILAVFYRYLFILVDEAEKMQQAVTGRSVGPLPVRRRLAMAGNLAGTLFLRSLERGETVYLAMCARGFDGHFPSLSRPAWGRGDALALTLALLAAVATLAMIAF